MSDFGDYDDGGGGYGDDWMYVEDYWDEANDLAEYTCPSPVPFDDISMLIDDYDVHDYWQDIEYISDGGYYEDHKSPQRKRKSLQSPKISSHRTKRRKNVLQGERQPFFGMSTVKWVPQRDRNHTLGDELPSPPGSTTSEVGRSVALLGDWKIRFKDAPGFGSSALSQSQSDEHEHQPITGEGFDLSDLQSIAGLLNEENMEALQEMLEERGLDPEALQLVIQDLLEGKERGFDDDTDADPPPNQREPDRKMRSNNSSGARDLGIDDMPPNLPSERGGNDQESGPISFREGPEPPSRGTRSKRKARPDLIVPDESPGKGRKKQRKQ